MRDVRSEALAYLTPPIGGFWRWDDDGTVAVMRGGGTIAFDAEIAAVLRNLATEGLPPLSAVLLLLAATRDTWPAYSLGAGLLAELTALEPQGCPEARLLPGLDRISQIDAALRAPLRAKVVLAEMILSGMTNARDSALSDAVVELLENGLGDAVRDGYVDEAPDTIVARIFMPGQLACLAPGLERFDVERFALRLQTGLDEAPPPAEVELPLADRVRALLAELEQDDELAALAGLARNLMAAVTLPRPVGEVDDMPLGGVSDITNRGPLDRLLLSELAHDDLTLAVRVAVGEALYLRRETPPRSPPRQRTMLLDAGLRTWGVPRVFAAAVALALAATADPRGELLAWRACGAELEPVDLASRRGIVEHLAALTAELHPGEALATLLERLPPEAAEPLLVTTDDTLEDPDFHAQVRETAAPLMIAAVNRDGDLRLYEDSPRGRKLVRQAQLDLESLLRTKTKRAMAVSDSLLDKRRALDLPAILCVEPFPLFLPQQVESRRAWCVEGRGVFVVSKDRRLLQFTAAQQGGRQWTDLLPSGHLVWAEGVERDGRTFAVVGGMQSGRLHLIDIAFDERRCEISPLEVEARPTTCVCSHLGALFVVQGRRVEVLEMATGRSLQTFALPDHLKHLRGRLFVAPVRGEYHTLSHDGATARFERVFGSHAERRPKLLTMFERRGIEGPIGVTMRGDLFFTATAEMREVPHCISGRVGVAAVSRDGRYLALGSAGTGLASAETRLDVDSMDLRQLNRANAQRLLEPEVFAKVSYRSLRHRLRSASPGVRHGILNLRTRGHFPLSLVYNEHRQTINLAHRELPFGTASEQVFVDDPTWHGAGYRLRVARWPGGRIVVDSRGLLHLIGGDKSLPEATLVLDDHHVTVWCNDGRTCGDEYFLGDAPTSSPLEIYETVIKPFVEGLR